MLDYLLNMLWTVSAGLLSLVALLGIFVSISSQQKIQKRRELYWELFQPEQRIIDRAGLSSEQIVANANYLQNRYKLYAYLESNEAAGILPIAIDGAVLLMRIVAIFWAGGISLAVFSVYNKALLNGLSLYDLSPDIFATGVFFSLLVIATIAMDKIRVVTEKLRTPWKTEELPTTHMLLDARNVAGPIDVLEYLINTLFVSLRVNRFDGKDWIQLRMVYPLPFYGFSINPEIEVHYKDGTKKSYSCGKQATVEYDAKLSPYESSAPLLFNFELNKGLKDEIESLKAIIEVQAGEKKKVAITQGTRNISELNEWCREIINVMTWLTEAELEKWDEDRRKIIVSRSIVDK